MRWLSRWMAVSLLGGALLGAAGCKQGVGERCQVQSDCDDTLLCVLPAGGTPQSGGTCQLAGGGVDMATSGGDMAVPGGDMAVAGDMTTPPDLTPPTD